MECEPEILDAGVYAIKSLKTGDMYIGSSCDLRQRLDGHVVCILRGRHPNKRIRQAFKGHSIIDIEIRVLERVNVLANGRGRDVLLWCEGDWIAELDPSLNIYKRRERVETTQTEESAA